MFYKIKKMIPQKLKNIFHFLKAVVANFCFGLPSRNIVVIGVTGTNGKTTTTQMIGRVLEVDGSKVAISSTINFKIGEEEKVNKTKFTTLSAWEIQKFLYQAGQSGCKYAVLEVSSHALDQNRVWGVDFDVAVLTNITREHFDYHKNLENYVVAKEKLFAFLKEKRFWFYRESFQKNPKTAVVNLQSDFADRFLKHQTDLKYGYCLKNLKTKIKEENVVKVIADNIQENSFGIDFVVNNEKIKLSLPGSFNVENALAAISVGLSQGIKITEIKKGLEKIKKIPGRMEYVENNLGISIVIDYALTPDSMKKVGEIFEELAGGRNGKLFWVFGSCGERDRGKRPVMGKIASSYADFVILTNEDPYHENPDTIINEISKGIENKIKDENFWIIMDRKSAIEKALQNAKANDVVLITGKGAEETMAIGDQRIEWNDKKIVEDILKYF